MFVGMRHYFMMGGSVRGFESIQRIIQYSIITPKQSYMYWWGMLPTKMIADLDLMPIVHCPCIISSRSHCFFHYVVFHSFL